MRLSTQQRYLVIGLGALILASALALAVPRFGIAAYSIGLAVLIGAALIGAWPQLRGGSALLVIALAALFGLGVLLIMALTALLLPG